MLPLVAYSFEARKLSFKCSDYFGSQKPKTLETAAENLKKVDAEPTGKAPAACVTDKGYHSRAVLKELDKSPWKTRISEPKRKDFARWHGDEEARRAVTNNRNRLLFGVAKSAFKHRAELCERAFAHILDRGGMRQTWLRGRQNIHKRYLIQVAGHNLSLLMRQMFGTETPKEAAERINGALFALLTPQGVFICLLVAIESGKTASFGFAVIEQ
jgi:hypothetical protein